MNLRRESGINTGKAGQRESDYCNKYPACSAHCGGSSYLNTLRPIVSFDIELRHFVRGRNVGSGSLTTHLFRVSADRCPRWANSGSDGTSVACQLLPQSQTCVGVFAMSVQCHKRTYHPDYRAFTP